MLAPVAGVSEVTKFEQVSIDGNQMPLAGCLCPVRSQVWSGGGVGAGGTKVHCVERAWARRFHTVRYNRSWVMVTWGPVDRQTDTSENITFP